MITKTQIKLGNVELDAYQLPEGSYARPGLFRLYTTDIYRYEDSWYWLSPNGLPALEIPVPKDISAVIDFCDLGNIVPDEVMVQLHRTFEECYSSDPLIRQVNRKSLLRDTANYLPRHLLKVIS